MHAIDFAAGIGAEPLQDGHFRPGKARLRCAEAMQGPVRPDQVVGVLPARITIADVNDVHRRGMGFYQLAVMAGEGLIGPTGKRPARPPERFPGIAV